MNQTAQNPSHKFIRIESFGGILLLLAAIIALVWANSPLQHLEHRLHNWVAWFVMPVFALANAGINIHSRPGFFRESRPDRFRQGGNPCRFVNCRNHRIPGFAFYHEEKLIPIVKGILPDSNKEKT